MCAGLAPGAVTCVSRALDRGSERERWGVEVAPSVEDTCHSLPKGPLDAPPCRFDMERQRMSTASEAGGTRSRHAIEGRDRDEARSRLGK
jgi:hypothetical protein